MPGWKRAITRALVAVILISLFLSQVSPRSGSKTPPFGGAPNRGHGTGFLPPTGEARRILESAPKIGSPSGPVPSGSVRWDLSPHFPPVGDQGVQGSCSAWAVNYYQNGFLQRVIHGWTDDAPEHLMSPAWSYNKANHGRNYGSSIVENILIIEELGSATMGTMPYDELDFSSQGNYSAWREAPAFRIGGFEVIDISTPSGIAALKERLARGLLATFVLDAFQLQPSFADGNFVVSSREYRSTYANHAQTIVGFDDSVQDDGDVGAFRVVNSWGSSWGDGGFYWITYKALYSRVSLGWRYAYVLIPRSWTPYNPRLLAQLHIDADASHPLNFTAGNGSVSIRIATEGIRVEGKIILDLTELFQNWTREGHPRVSLTVGPGTEVRSFRIEYHPHGYLDPWQTSPESPEVPFSGPGTIRSHSFAPAEKAAFAAVSGEPIVIPPSGGNVLLRLGNAGNLTSTITAELSCIWATSPTRVSATLEPGEIEDFSISISPDSGPGSWASISVTAHVEGGLGFQANYTVVVGYRGLRIYGDGQLREMAAELGWPGSGTEGDPIVAEDLFLYGGSLAISNTTLHLLIRNVTVWNSPRGISISGSNFTIEGSLVQNATGPGILILGSKHFSIENCSVENAGNSAIWVGGSEDFVVSGNTIVGESEGGIFIESSMDFSLLQNDLYGVGIALWGGPDTYSSARIEGNEVNGLPFLFVRDQNGFVVSGELGSLLIFNSTDVLVKDAEISGSSTPVFIASSSNVRILDSDLGLGSWNGIYAGYVGGLQLNNVTTGGNSYYGLWAYRSSGVSIKDSRLYGNYEGIVVQDCEGTTVSNASIDGNFWAGLWANNSTGLRILDSEFSGNYIGIDIENSVDVGIEDSRVTEDGASGLLLMNVNYASISRSEISGNSLVSIQASFSSNLTIEGVNASNSGTGILLAFSDLVMIRYSNISLNSGYGLMSLGSQRVSITSSLFRANGLYGVYLHGSHGCLIHSNSFVGNRGSGERFDPLRVQAFDDSSNSWNSSKGGNYWEDWAMNNETNDRDGDGIVDFPYPIDGGASDELPLKYPPQEGVDEFPAF